MAMKNREFSMTEKDENGNVYHDMLFVEHPDGSVEKTWDWFNDGKHITVTQYKNRDKNGNFYTSVHKYKASGKVINGRYC